VSSLLTHFFYSFLYSAGGELFFHLGREGKFDEDRSRFYTAQIVLALEHLHMMNVIYRDLKPENVLLDHNGNIRLTDFGLSKENVDAVDKGAHSFCGTPEYLAPEVLSRSGHGRAVDWWSLGALLFEMLTGLPPFYSRDRNVLFEKIQKGDLEYPGYLSTNAKDVLRKLLVRDPLARLGSGPGDAAELKAHPFFGPIDWKAVLEGRVEVPWVPVVRNSADTSQFDTEFTTMDVHSPSSVAASNLLAAGGGGASAGHLTPQQQEALVAQQQQQIWAQQQAAQMKLQQQQQSQGAGSSSSTIVGSGVVGGGGGGGGGGIALASHPMIDSSSSIPRQQPFEGFTYIAPHQIGKAKGMATTCVVAGDRLASGNVNPQLTQSNPPPLAWGQQTKQQAQGGGDGGMRMSMDVESSTGVREDEAGDAEMR
jgi:serine/threonine protein kinase